MYFLIGAPTERDEDLRGIVDEAFDFPLEQVAVADRIHALELFHGPTLAFKDVALQMLGLLFEKFLSRSEAHLTIVGATSGDTGSAAIYGVRGKRNINIFIYG